jgi:uncharacterized protein YcfJ
MRQTVAKGLMFGAMLAIVNGVVVGAELSKGKTDSAEVSQVTPVMKTLRTPRQSCRDEEVIYVQPQSRWRGITGTVLGAILGGAVGNQIGNGDGRKIATGVGTVAGAYAGNRAMANTRSDNVFINTDRRCLTVVDKEDVLVGYDVRYRIAGEPEALVRTSYDPGKRIPLRGGKLLLDGKTR